MKQRCKTCRHWNKHKKQLTGLHVYGDCLCPYPDWVLDALEEYDPNTQRGYNDGEYCDCWEAPND